MFKDTKDFIVSIATLVCFFVVVSLIPIAFTSCEDEEPSKSMSQELSEKDEIQRQEAEDAYYEEIYYKAEQANAIDWDEAENHIGEYVTVFGKVVEVSQPDTSGDPIFVNIGNAYPDKRVTGVCWEEHHSDFDDLFQYEGTMILMEGTLYMYDGMPNIELTDSFQIEKL